MKIVCQREDLAHSVAIAAGVAPSRATRPILCGVKISATKKGTTLLATDLEVSAGVRLREAIVQKEGQTVVTAATLLEILRSIESAEVTLQADGRFCHIRAEDAEYKLVTEDPEEFPEVEAAPDAGVQVPRTFIEELFARTSYAAARDVGRYAINGILVEIGDKRVRFVTTDGRRMAICSRDLPEADHKVKGAIVPVKGLAEALRASEGAATIRLSVEENRVVLSSDLADVITKPVQGEFPDYQSVIPQEKKGTATIERDVLLAAIRKVSVLRVEEMRSVRFAIKGSTITITSQVEGRGEAKTTITAKVEGLSEYSVDFNPDFLQDHLKPLPSQPVQFEYRDENSAGLFRLAGGSDVYLVMPITTS